MATNDYQFVTTDEAAVILQVHKNTIYRAIRAGKIPYVKAGNQFRIPCSYFEATTNESEDIDEVCRDLTEAEQELFHGTEDDYLKLAL